MAKPLVIVESPAKAKTIAGFLGSDYLVEASVGHIRDLPDRAADIPEAYRSERWARLGVDVENDFKPLYIVPRQKKEQVRKLKSLVKEASELYLATDEDREGESIAWHLLEVLNPRVPVKRMVFHEITRPAIERAVREWRDLDRRLVDAQEARRILDRLVGWEVSAVLWKKVNAGLSAGRVQSVATRLLVERERARIHFVTASYWDIEGRFQKVGTRESFPATLVAVDGRRLATGKDFGDDGRLHDGSAGAASRSAGAAGAAGGGRAPSVPLRLDETAATGLAARLDGADFSVRSVDEKPYRRSPYAPFMTSTLQQEAGRKLRFSAKRAMSIAQDLYEQGYITYMRTDSTTLSEQALNAARAQARSLYGEAFVPPQPRRYDKKVKNAQEAHEAIRPAGETFRTPEQTRLSGDMFRLYDLIWKRTVASQMADARGHSVQVRLAARSSAGEDAEFSASGKTIEFPGFLRAYVEGSDDPNAALEDQEVRLPVLAAGDPLDALELAPRGHATQPPARYTEASLVKALEDLGVGRPSTYATIIDTIQARGYVHKKGTALVPTWTAFAVVGLLEQYFTQLVDYGFTAQMEETLDQIAGGQGEATPWLHRFYFGDGDGHQASPDSAMGAPAMGAGLNQMVHDQLNLIDAREINSIPVGDGIVVRVGRYGPYVQRGEETAQVPEDLAPDELTVAKAEELLGAGSGDRVLGTDPVSGLGVVARAGRFGPYVQLGGTEAADGTTDGAANGAAASPAGTAKAKAASPAGTAKAKAAKPKTQSLLKGMALETVTLDDALQLLSLPRVVGVADDGEEIVATSGRFGPYLKKGSDSRSLTSDGQLFTVTLDEARALFAQPKAMRGRGASAAPLRELGPDPSSGGPVVVKEGRFGPYVTDGVTNASLRKGDTVEEVTLERAAELLADRRRAGPSTRSARSSRPGTAKKTATKATGAKKTATKATAAKAATAAATTKAGTAKAGTAKKRGTAKKAVPAKSTAARKAPETT
ncbi:MAG: type I DNA topoisomerase [Acidimicrobiales bacterium]